MRGPGHLAARIRRITAGRDKLLPFEPLSHPPAGGTARKSSISAPAFLPAALRGTTRSGFRDEAEAEGPKVICIPQNCSPPRKQKVKLQRSLYVTFVGSQGPQALRVSASFLGRHRAGVEFSSSPTGGLAVRPGPRTVRSSGSSPGDPASWQPWSPVCLFDDWWGLPPRALFYFMIYATRV